MRVVIQRVRDYRTGLSVSMIVEAAGARLILDTACAECGENNALREDLYFLEIGLCCRCEATTALWARRAA